MAFNGAGVFNRLYSWVTDAANGIKIRADRMDAETNGIATGLSTCVTRDGQSAATANLPMGGFRHTNVGAAQNPTDYATAGQVVNSGLTYATGVGGTSNAVTLTTTVAPTALAAGQLVMFKATSDVVAGGVTVNRSVLGAKAVQQFGAALPAGAWLNGDIVILEYDGTQYQLIWPLRTAGLLGSNNVWTGNQTISNGGPTLSFRETDQALPLGLLRFILQGNAFSLQRNTAVAGDWSTSTLPFSVASTDVITFAQPPVMSGASITALNASSLSSGTVPDARFPATLPAVSGVNLTALNANNLGSGTVPDARFPATLPAISGANLTSLNASNVSSGTLADARLSTNIPLKNAANTWSASQTISTAQPTFGWNDSGSNFTSYMDNLNGSVRWLVRDKTSGVYTTLMTFNGATGVGTFGQPPVMSGASITNIPAANLTGTLPNGVFPATLPAASGVNLTALNASNLGSGTVPDARFPATLPAISGVNLTNLNASNLASGTVPAARLPNPAAGTLGGVKSLAAVAHKFLTSIGTDGLPVAATPVLADISDAGTAAAQATGTSGHTLGFNDGANTYSGLQTFSAGANLTPAAAPATNAIGYLGTPQNVQNAAYGLVMSDAGKQIYHSDATPRTYTIPANSSVAFPIGTKIEIVNDNGAAAVTIAITTDTLRWIPSGGTGSRTLAANGSAILSKITATTWQITGVGLT